MAALFAEKDGKVLVKKRSQDEKWLKGMWEFPSAEGKSFEDARHRLEKDLGLHTDPQPLQEVKHQITHHKVHLKLFRAIPKKGKKLPAGLKWVGSKELLGLPFSSAQSKLRKWVLDR
jgi:adenine-specific DNA glycosylase